MDQNQQTEEQEIDLLELAQKLWRRRKSFYKTCGIAVVVALVVAFSIPKEYAVTVTLSPESGESSGSGSLGGIASMMGVNLGSGDGADALNITLFPDILSSNPFALELYGMPVPVEDGEETTSMPLNEYMESQSKPWWGWLMSLPGKAVGGILSLFYERSGGQGERSWARSDRTWLRDSGAEQEETERCQPVGHPGLCHFVCLVGHNGSLDNESGEITPFGGHSLLKTPLSGDALLHLRIFFCSLLSISCKNFIFVRLIIITNVL